MLPDNAVAGKPNTKALGKTHIMNPGIMINSGSKNDDIKADVKELVDIAIADKISVKKISGYRSLIDKRYRVMLKQRLEHELRISYITDISIISKRFADKLLSVLSKYDEDEDRRLIIQCIDLMVSKARREQGYKSVE
jgi:hypothetical protein